MLQTLRTRRWSIAPMALMLAVGIVLGGAVAQDGEAAQPEGEDAGVGTFGTMPDVTIFGDAFDEFGVAEQLDEGAAYTVFAPTDVALTEYGTVFMSADDLLGYIVEGTHLQAALLEQAQGAGDEGVTLTTLAGTEITIGADEAGNLILNGQTLVTQPDTALGNFTVHTIDDVFTVEEPESQ